MVKICFDKPVILKIRKQHVYGQYALGDANLPFYLIEEITNKQKVKKT